MLGESAADVGAWDASDALVAFVGITAYLPNTVVSLVFGVGGLAGKLAEVLSAWVARRWFPLPPTLRSKGRATSGARLSLDVRLLGHGKRPLHRIHYVPSVPR